MAASRTCRFRPAVDEDSRNRHGFAAVGAIVSTPRAEGCGPTLGGGARGATAASATSESVAPAMGSGV
jgi:hypothetical protein